jgi:hypothetical protein
MDKTKFVVFRKGGIVKEKKNGVIMMFKLML